MKKRLLTLALTLAALVTLAGATALAVDLTRRASLTVIPSGEEYAEDLAGAELVMDLYHVAAAEETPGQDAYGYRFLGAYGGLSVPQEPTAEDWEALSQAAARIAVGEGSTEQPAATALPGTAQTDLAPGLYLLVPHGAALEKEDYVKKIPAQDLTGENGETEAGGEENLGTLAYTKEFVYTFAPQLVSLPSKEAGEDGVIRTDAPGEWLYDVTVQLKPERDYRFGALEIVKGLDVYEDSSPATFVFRVTAELDGETVYNNVVSLTFTGPGEQTYRVERLPVGAEVTVTEIYSGSSYTLTTDNDQTAVIGANSVVTVRFENTYGERLNRGYGVQNSFTYDESTGSWQWIQG